MSFLEGARFADMALHLFALPLLFVPTVSRMLLPSRNACTQYVVYTML